MENLSIIVARSENGVIGNNNDIPWHLPNDLSRFKRLTKGHTVIMGRKTYESIVNRIGGPLPDRQTIILTTKKGFRAKGCKVVHSWNACKTLLVKRSVGNLRYSSFIIGGESLYRAALPDATKLYITMVHTVCDGDIFFPVYDLGLWSAVHQKFIPKNKNNEYDSTFTVYKRNSIYS